MTTRIKRLLRAIYHRAPSRLRPWMSTSWNRARRRLMAQQRPRRRPRGSARPVDVVGNPTSDPLITIVVPAWNEQEHLGACLASIRSQTLTDWECIVVDDGSWDLTLDVAVDAQRADDRIRVVRHHESRGLSRARNSGLDAARGRFITFLDGDDFLYPDALSRRITPLLSAEEEVAGVYGDWVSVAANAPLGPPPRPSRHLQPIDYLTSEGKAPFIASAPLLRTDVVRRHHGFDASFGSSEDYDLWTRIMRSGHRFEPADVVAVAYRQRRAGMVQGNPAAHAAFAAKVMEWQSSEWNEDVVDGPYVFSRPRPHYDEARQRLERLTASLALALASNDDDQIAGVEQLLPEDAAIIGERALDIVDLARRSLGRVVVADASIDARDVDAIARETARIIGEVEPPAAPPHTPVRAEVRRPERAHPVNPITPLEVPTGRGSTIGDVLLVPQARYHADELVPLAHELGDLGVEASILLTPREGPSVLKELLKYDVPVYSMPDDLNALPDFRAFVTLNDWGPTRPLADLARRRGALSFAKVEGVQDFEDADTGRIRRAYRNSDVVLCQGANDTEALDDQDTVVVGNSRLEHVASEGHHPLPAARRVVINSNFTYNVLTDQRSRWLDSVLDACREVGADPIISQHHADGAIDRGLPVALRPMKWLLRHDADVLVSRFSTVPFEAMARGVPFVYHNPHGELVPTFADPHGAYEISTDVSSLAAALDAALSEPAARAGAATHFFERQVDIDPMASAAARSAAAIAERVR